MKVFLLPYLHMQLESLCGMSEFLSRESCINVSKSMGGGWGSIQQTQPDHIHDLFPGSQLEKLPCVFSSHLPDVTKLDNAWQYLNFERQSFAWPSQHFPGFWLVSHNISRALIGWCWCRHPISHHHPLLAKSSKQTKYQIPRSLDCLHWLSNDY